VPVKTKKCETVNVLALRAHANVGKLLRRLEDERRSLVIEKHSTARTVLSIRDYARLAAPEPEVLKVIGEESKRHGTNALSSNRIDEIIKATRAQTTRR
jgi:hypothetical protein